MLSAAEARALVGVPAAELLDEAGRLRDRGHGDHVTFSPKVFIPLTMLCRDRCHYCTFAQPPARLDSPYLTPEQVLAIATAGAEAGCHEALFTLGERPEDRYPVAAEWLAAHGVKAWTEDAAPGRPNVVGEVGSGEGPSLVLCAHLDTVGTAGMERPFEPRVEGDRMFGRGAYDMKGGLAACMATAAALAVESLAGKLMLTLVADEEYASIGARGFVDRHTADACILTEASELVAKLHR